MGHVEISYVCQSPATTDEKKAMKATTDLQEGLEGCNRRQSGREGICGRVTVQRYPLDQGRLSKQRRWVSEAAL